jgi:hypothetical protein
LRVTIMSPDTPMFGRITIGTNRISLGRAGTTTLLVRVSEQMRKLRATEESIIQIELSRSPLPDATTFDRLARQEQQFAERIETDPTAESPWPGITIGRVSECMASPEYEAFNEICDPEKRMLLTPEQINEIQWAYQRAYPDCARHFPKML